MMPTVKQFLKAIIILLISPAVIFAQGKFNDIPELDISLEELSQTIIPYAVWKPFPDINTPNIVPQHVKQAYIKEAEDMLNESWTPLPASVFLEYSKTNNRENFELISFERRKRLSTLVLAEVFENKGRFTKQIIDGIWAICEESFWGVPAHLFLQKVDGGLPDVNDPVVDLFASETAAEMAWVYYLLKPQLDLVNPLIAQRIKDEVNRRILKPYLNHKDWAYLGYTWQQNPDKLRRVNNWNPWVNANVLAATLILADDEERNSLICKTLETTKFYLQPFPKDGGSDEGPQYWPRAAGALFDYLELLKSASNSKIDAFKNPLIKKMGAYIYKAYIKDRYFINYGDADAVLDIDPALLFRFGKQIEDQTLTEYGAYLAKKTGYGTGVLPGEFGIFSRVLPGLFSLKAIAKTEGKEPLLKDIWFPEIELMVARSKAGSAEGLYLSVKGGNNGVSHNHNDIGNFIVYADGSPIIIDAGTQTYNAQTFSTKRYDLWNNQSAYHNLPTINGIMQKEGADFKATDINYSANKKQAEITMDIATAYPAEAKVVQWLRKVKLIRGEEVQLHENFKLQEYLRPYEENFLSPLTPRLEKNGVVSLTNQSTGKTYHIYFDENKFDFYADKITIPKPVVNADNSQLPERMSLAWGNVLYRVRLVSNVRKLRDQIHFIIK